MNKAYLLLPALVLAGCQSQRLALGPVPSPTPVAPVPTALADSATALVVLRVPGVAGLPAVSPPHQAPTRHHRPAPVAALPTTTVAFAPVAPTRPRLLQRLALRKLATAGPAHTTESGLGGIAFFAIAVVLGLLAGLAALFALIPGVSFWGGLGLAVGSFVVIGLLYKLLSGKKKQ